MITIKALKIIRDLLREKLTDPYTLAGGRDRGGDMWIFGDEPVSMPKFPQIQIKKLDNPTQPIDIGPNYYEQEQLIARIWFYSKNGFKLSYEGVTYTNAEVVELYQGIIKKLLKANFVELEHACLGSYKHLNTTTVAYEPETQLYVGSVDIRVRWFSR